MTIRKRKNTGCRLPPLLTINHCPLSFCLCLLIVHCALLLLTSVFTDSATKRGERRRTCRQCSLRPQKKQRRKYSRTPRLPKKQPIPLQKLNYEKSYSSNVTCFFSGFAFVVNPDATIVIHISSSFSSSFIE